uniref:Uncharacterized protein n=1 Tax=Glossina pallidipes TaxID=7398 RepID=A0A1B0AD23_GLOPL
MAAALDGYLACKRTESSTKIWSCTSKATKSFSKPSCFLNKAKAEFKSLPNSVDKAAITSPLSIFMPWPSNGNMARTCGNNLVSVTLRCSSFSTHSSSQTSFGTRRVSLTHSSVCSISGISGSLDDNSKVQMPALISLSACWFKFRISPDCWRRISINTSSAFQCSSKESIRLLISKHLGCFSAINRLPASDICVDFGLRTLISSSSALCFCCKDNTALFTCNSCNECACSNSSTPSRWGPTSSDLNCTCNSLMDSVVLLEIEKV